MHGKGSVDPLAANSAPGPAEEKVAKARERAIQGLMKLSGKSRKIIEAMVDTSADRGST
jgi:hypothetical protein